MLRLQLTGISVTNEMQLTDISAIIEISKQVHYYDTQLSAAPRAFVFSEPRGGLSPTDGLGEMPNGRAEH